VAGKYATLLAFLLVLALLAAHASRGEHTVYDRDTGRSMRTADRDVTVTARFDPADHAHEGGTCPDVIGTSPVETPSEFLATLQRFLAW
jgi:hypothetical protein